MASKREPINLELEEEEDESEEETEDTENEVEGEVPGSSEGEIQAEPVVTEPTDTEDETEAEEEVQDTTEEEGSLDPESEVPEPSETADEIETNEPVPEESLDETEGDFEFEESSESEAMKESEIPKPAEAKPPGTSKEGTGKSKTEVPKDPNEPATPEEEEEEELPNPEDLISKLDHEKLDTRPVSACDIKDLIRRGSILHLQRHYGIKETDDLEKLWKLKRSKLVDQLFDPETENAESLYKYSNELLDAYKRQRIAADALAIKYLKRVMD